MQIYQYLNKHINTDFTCNEDMPFEVNCVEFNEGEIIVDYEQTAKNVYFLLEGIGQAEVYNSEGKEYILDLYFPNDFFAAYISVASQQPSKTRISALSTCKCEVFKGEDIRSLYPHSLMMNQTVRFIMERRFFQKTQREIDLMTKTAKERYLDLLHTHPEIINEIPLKKIAMYLGIQAESLSRIRKGLIS